MLRESVGIYPLYDSAWIDLGIAQMRSGSEQEAEVSLKEALRLRSDSPDAHLTLGTLYYRNGRTGEALQHLEKAVALAPEMADAHFILVTLYLKTGEFKQAVEQFQAGVSVDPNRGDIHNNLAIALFAEGNQEEARRHALEAGPGAFAGTNTSLPASVPGTTSTSCVRSVVKCPACRSSPSPGFWLLRAQGSTANNWWFMAVAPRAFPRRKRKATNQDSLVVSNCGLVLKWRGDSCVISA